VGESRRQKRRGGKRELGGQFQRDPTGDENRHHWVRDARGVHVERTPKEMVHIAQESFQRIICGEGRRNERD